MTPSDPRLDPHAAPYALAAQVALWIEAIVQAFWPPLTFLVAFIAATLFDVPAALPALLHAVLLLACACWLALLTRRAIEGFRAPTPEATLRRLERDSGLAHRPFETLADHAVAETGAAERTLWRMHQDRKRREARFLRISLPRPNLPDRDPRALRFAALIALAVGLVVAGPRAGNLIFGALTPNFSTTDAPIPLDAWIKPPDYTGLPSIVLKPGDDKPVSVPIGSTIEAHVTGGSRPPSLVLGSERQEFKKLDGGGFAMTRTLSAAGTLKISRGWSTLGRWRIEIVPDEPPTVAFTDPPAPASSGALKLNYEASDDYGVASVALKIRRVPDRRQIVADPIDVTLSSGQNDKDLRGSSYQDLTAHPWAGMPVIAKLVATDVPGNTGESEEVAMTLPERSFSNAVARSIVALRKHVILGDTPRRDLASRVAGIIAEPDSYGGDTSVYLALRTATTQLRQTNPADSDAVASIEDLLWNAALRIEDGDRPEAEKALRAAEDALKKALQDPNTPASEIEKLTQQLKDALNREMDALAENLRQRMARGDQPSQPKPDENVRTLDRKDLQDQVDQMNQMAQNGARQAAEDMLDQLKSMMDNLGDEAQQAQKDAQQAQKDEQGQKTVDQLKDLAQKQLNLMGEQGSDSGGSDATGSHGGKAAAEAQESLRQQLGDAMRQLKDANGQTGEDGHASKDGKPGQAQQDLEAADNAMRNATRSLQQGKGDAAKEQQAEAARRLEQSAETLSEQLAQEGKSNSKSDGAESRDPFGRSTGNGLDVKVPTEREMQRSRAILDELRRRFGERDRPRYELDYIQRLLQQF